MYMVKPKISIVSIPPVYNDYIDNNSVRKLNDGKENESKAEFFEFFKNFVKCYNGAYKVCKEHRFDSWNSKLILSEINKRYRKEWLIDLD